MKRFLFLFLFFLFSSRPSPTAAADAGLVSEPVPTAAGEILSGPAIGAEFFDAGAVQLRLDEARYQEDSELFRFALVAFFAVWASKTITQRRLH